MFKKIAVAFDEPPEAERPFDPRLIWPSLPARN